MHVQGGHGSSPHRKASTPLLPPSRLPPTPSAIIFLPRQPVSAGTRHHRIRTETSDARVPQPTYLGLGESFLKESWQPGKESEKRAGGGKLSDDDSPGNTQRGGNNQERRVTRGGKQALERPNISVPGL